MSFCSLLAFLVSAEKSVESLIGGNFVGYFVVVFSPSGSLSLGNDSFNMAWRRFFCVEIIKCLLAS